MGAVGSSHSLNQLTVLGDAANTTARLASAAGAGEILISVDACERGSIDLPDAETRILDLRGKAQPVPVKVLTAQGLQLAG